MVKGFLCMKRIFALPLLMAVLLACAHGKTDSFPTLEDPADNAQVYVIRDNNLMGWGFSLKVVLDDSIIARLRSGEYISFFVKPGFHSPDFTPWEYPNPPLPSRLRGPRRTTF